MQHQSMADQLCPNNNTLIIAMLIKCLFHFVKNKLIITNINLWVKVITIIRVWHFCFDHYSFLLQTLQLKCAFTHQG